MGRGEEWRGGWDRGVERWVGVRSGEVGGWRGGWV